MYETEINSSIETAYDLPPEMLRMMAALRSNVTHRTLLPWSEHCTECVWPTCYTSCDLYVPRADGRCRRFANGMVRADVPGADGAYLLKIQFKKWGKLWAPGNTRLLSVAAAERIEKRDFRIGRALQSFVVLPPLKTFAARKRYALKKRIAQRRRTSSVNSTSFVVECFNPAQVDVRLSLTIRQVGGSSLIPFQAVLTAVPGAHQFKVPTADIARVIDLTQPFEIELLPADVDAEVTLFFGMMDFVTERQTPQAQPGKVKCVVWDLDNTIWKGTLVEDGPENLVLKEGIVQVIKELDHRGILQSVASKNSPDDALQVLERFGLSEYFLYPQISWLPKGEAVKTIAAKLNIGIESLLFLDDAPFELAEVKATCPTVRVMDSREYGTLLSREDCLVPVTEESRMRRLMYKVDAERQAVATDFGSDYFGFLKSCVIKLSIRSLTAEDLERAHELTQRTNQMNFSGNRYDREILKTLMSDPDLDTFVLSCEDRFGSYGVIGFSVVDRREPRMIDLMFSCRIQSKRVEHAFLNFLIPKYIRESNRDFFANYRKTKKNEPSGKVFSDLGFEVQGELDGVLSLRFSKDRSVPDDGVIEILVPEPAVAQASR